VNKSHLYLPYQINSQTKEVYDFGDTGTKLLPLSNFAAVLFRTRDPLLKWLENLAPGESEADLLFGDDSIRPESPAGRLSPVRLFRDVGTAVFRSGFAPDDFCFVFRAGPFYNHQHFDQGSFFLADRGEDFLTEGGRTDYYSDPWYQGFFIQPGAHNCILVDDNVESQRAGDLLDDVKAWQDYARITDFLDFDDGAFLSAELAPIYQGKFQTLRRSLLYLKPRTIVLIDTGEGAREADRLNLRFHAPLKEDIWLAGNTAVIKRKSRELCLRTLQPGDVIAEIRKRPLSLYEFAAENPITMKARGFLQLSAGIEGGLVQFINLMGTDSSLVSGAGLADRGPYFELQAGGRRYLVKKPGSARFEADGWVIAADLFSQKDGGIRALRVTEIQEDSRPIFRSDSPVSLAMEKQKKSLTFSTWARRKSRVEIVSPSKPRAVERNGRLFQPWSWAKGAVLLEIPEEASTSRIVY
jgi:hypothetical protein